MAVSLSDPIRQWLRELQHELRQHDLPMRWVVPDNIHLTLIFLGNTAPHKIQPVKDALVKAGKGHRPMQLQAAGLGVFPRLSNPRVLWAGLKGDIFALATLRKAIDNGLNRLDLGLGENERRSFRPHLTLGRFRHKVAPQKLADVIRVLGQRQSVSFEVDRFHLLKSTLRPQAAIYTQLKTVILAS